MIFFYSAYNFILFYIGTKKFRSIFNPICIYVGIWEIAILFHESNLISFNPITVYCWFVIFFLQTIFIFGCLTTTRTHPTNVRAQVINPFFEKKQLKLFIFLTFLISGIAIVFNFFYAFKIYGAGLFSNVTQVYFDRITEAEETRVIPYLGSLIFLTFSLIGVYLKKYGFSIYFVPAIFLSIMNALTSGGRAGLVFSLLLFFFSYILTVRKDNKRKKATNKLLLIVAVSVFIVLILIISGKRNGGMDATHATSLYKNIFGDNILIYKIIEYISTPIGVLNEYLGESEVHFAQNSFLPIFNILSKLGVIDRINQYQEFFYTPIYSNVGTWLRELIEDFSIIGAIPLIFLFGYIIGTTYEQAHSKNNLKYILLCSSLYLILSFTFFDWRLRTANTWIVIILSYFVGKTIDNRSVSKQNCRLNEKTVTNDAYSSQWKTQCPVALSISLLTWASPLKQLRLFSLILRAQAACICQWRKRKRTISYSIVPLEPTGTRAGPNYYSSFRCWWGEKQHSILKETSGPDHLLALHCDKIWLGSMFFLGRELCI